MSVTVTLYKNLSDKKRAQKNLTTIASESCTFKGDVDVMAPVLLFYGDAETYAKDVNYMYVDAFRRFYFCRVKSLPGGLVELSGTVDVLTSAWALGLPTLRAVIARQENRYNLYLNDGTLKAYANDLIQTLEWPEGFSTPAYVCIVAG